MSQGEPKGEALEVVTNSLRYLGKRRAQIRYAESVALGYPIGSGAVESVNKLVVESRLKGAGMHWAPEHVNPMVALRTVVCSDRWDEAWEQIAERLRQEPKEGVAERQAKRQAAKVAEKDEGVATEAMEGHPRVADSEPVAVLAAETSRGVVAEEAAASVVSGAKEDKAGPGPAEGKQTRLPHKPAPDHVWRRMRIGKAIWAEPRQDASAES